MLYCGIRPSEASYIQGKDIKDGILHVRGKKSKASDRYVPIPDVLLERLREYDDEEYVITSYTGIAPVREYHRNKMWNSFKLELSKHMNVSSDLKPYCFRHTYCTDLQDANVPITTAKYLMGHSTITLTANVYTHQSEESFTITKERINSHINSHNNNNV